MEVISLLLGVAGLVLTIFYGFREGHSYRRLQNAMDAALMDRLAIRVKTGNINSGAQLKGLAATLAEEYCVGMPTDRQLISVVRRLALRLEDAGNLDLVRVLESIRKDLEPQGLPILSIANTDRLLALQLMIPFIVAGVLAIHALLAFSSAGISGYVVPAAIALEATYVVLAVRMWRRLGSLARKIVGS